RESMTATYCLPDVVTASYSLSAPDDGPWCVAPQANTRNPRHAIADVRMLVTSPPIHRSIGDGSSGERSGDVERLCFCHVAFDAHDRAVVVEDQRVRGQAHRLAVEAAVGVGEGEGMRAARDPVALVSPDADLLDRRVRAEHLLKEDLVHLALRFGDQD